MGQAKPIPVSTKNPPLPPPPKQKNHQKTNKRVATICKRKGSTIWKLHPVFLFFFCLQYWVFFRSVCEKLRKDLKFRNSKLAASSSSSSSSLTDFRL
ncbi:unnamed protein product [Sphagnum jensenii]|uniref:Uncharacterized protein n=1 Tax=Sphagnum jensenii TaxID=128206 RepID=A0ABP0WLN6_9BRYO